jgi:hypothetical protein
MFTKAFVTRSIESNLTGNPAVVTSPILWATHLMIHHAAVYNGVFATLQVVIAFGLLWRRTVKAALALSIPWSIGVWWIGEGLGNILTGRASPISGAPGAVILYVFLAVLAWPSNAVCPAGRSVATSGRLGALTPRALWVGLLAGLVYFALSPVNRSPSALRTMILGMKGGEPGWIKGVDDTVGNMLLHRGTEASIVFALLCGLAAVAIASGWALRVGVVSASILGLAIWVAEDFGGILTGQGTDPNSGLLLVVAALTFWPVDRGGQTSAGGLLAELSYGQAPGF